MYLVAKSVHCSVSSTCDYILLGYSRYNSLVLEVKQFCIDLLNVHINPEDVKVATDAGHDIIVQAIELLQQVEFLLDAGQRWVVCYRQPKQLLPSRVCAKLAPQVSKRALSGTHNVIK